MAYVDGFVVAVPEKRIADYKKLARKAGKIWLEHGALEYVECIADDVPVGKLTSFPRAVKLKDDEVVAFSWIIYKSRSDRDAVLKNREAALQRQFRQQAPGVTILDAECLPVDPPGGRRADPGERVEPSKQPLAIDLRHQSHRLRPRMKAFTRCGSTWFHQTPSCFSELATMTPSTMSRMSLALSGVTPLPTSVGSPAASLIILM